MTGYRFPRWKDAPWNSYKRQKARYEIIRPYLGTHSVGAEIGVYKGGFGEFLLEHCKKLYLVDAWYRHAPYWKSGIEGDSRVDTVIDLLSKYRNEIHEGRVEVVVEYSDNFLRNIGQNTLDFIYLDSSHQYQATAEELALASRAVKPGGILLGDDYVADPNSIHYGVCRAVTELVQANGAELMFTESRQWGVRVT